MTVGTGGVLSDVEIKAAMKAKKLIVKCKIEQSALRPAAYDVQVAQDGLIGPSGKEVPPDESGKRSRKIVLEPGDAALLSTVEEFRLPLDIAGNITIKNRVATQGLLLLSGMLIDPGYGWDEGDQASGSRLYLHVANVGKQTVEIRPGADRIASIQFLLVHGAHDRLTRDVPGSMWVNQTLPSLGFLTEMKRLKEQVERSDTRSEQVLTFGFVVLAVALISTSLTTILAIAQKHGAMTDIHRLEAHTTGILLLSGLILVPLVSIWGILRVTPRRAQALSGRISAARSSRRARPVNRE